MTIVPSLRLFQREEPDTAPANIEAEQALLGAILFDNTALAALADIALEDRHFYEPLHQRLFAAIKTCAAAGRLAEPIVLMERFKDDPAFNELGGLRYLADLVDRAPPAALAYGRVVLDLALRRDLVAVGRAIVDSAHHDAEHDAHGLTVLAEQAIGEIARGAAPGDANLIDARSSVYATMDEIDEESAHGKPKGKMTGLRCIDRRLRGLKPGHLVVIGGRPSMGKTALARAAAAGCASRNPHDLVAFFALEMDRRELDERMLSELSFLDGDGVPYQDMSGAKLDPMTRLRLREAAWKVPKNLIIDDASRLTLEHVQRRVWALKRKGNLTVAFVDYLQIMQMPERQGRTDTALIGHITTGLKVLAGEARICIVLLSQLSREVERRDDKRPMLSDLRDSGSIEQDANAVLYPFREGYYVERAEPKEGSVEHIQWETDVEMLRRRMDVICAKNRGGAVGTDRQEYFAEFDVVRDMVEDMR